MTEYTSEKEYLKLALGQARESVKKGGFPAGAIVVKDGKVVSKKHRKYAKNRTSFHP